MLKIDNILKVLNKYVDLTKIVKILEITPWFTPNNAKLIAQIFTGGAFIMSIIIGSFLFIQGPYKYLGVHKRSLTHSKRSYSYRRYDNYRNE